jgi:hypothetical protein
MAAPVLLYLAFLGAPEPAPAPPAPASVPLEVECRPKRAESRELVCTPKRKGAAAP